MPENVADAGEARQLQEEDCQSCDLEDRITIVISDEPSEKGDVLDALANYLIEYCESQES